LKAIPEVLDDFPDAKLIIVGSKINSQQSYIDDLYDLISRLGLKDSVQFTGWRSDIPEMLCLFDIFVLSSVTEACPTVVFEAMAMNCPVVATDVGGVNEQIPSEEYGQIVPPQNVKALSQAIVDEIVSDSDSGARNNNKRKLVRERFSKDRCVEKHLEVYESAGVNLAGGGTIT
jgi:glycosyltransferase involved in cell wall biosynthesis